MLESVETERGDGGGVWMAENPEHAAFLAERVAVGVRIRIGRKRVAGRALLTVHCASH
jgi:hypothetical protein